MKLADDALLMMIEIFRQGILEGRDISQLLRELDLREDAEGKLGLAKLTWTPPSEAD